MQHELSNRIKARASNALVVGSAAVGGIACLPGVSAAVDFSETTDMIVSLLPVIVMFMLIGMIVGMLGSIKFGGKK
jgi:hypothetical protein